MRLSNSARGRSSKVSGRIHSPSGFPAGTGSIAARGWKAAICGRIVDVFDGRPYHLRVRVFHYTIVVLMLTSVVWIMNRGASATSAPPSSKAVQRVQWAALRTLDQVRALDRTDIAVLGYVVPLEDNLGMTGEFLLVPYFGACIHSPPPPPNQMIYVRMSGGRQIHTPTASVLVHGKLRIAGRE
jgi:hypothetical protein